MKKLKEKSRIKTRNKQEKGITLIALVITIIVLLILAGVGISALMGDNGVINQAVQAREENEKAEEKEKVGLAAQAAKSKTNWEEIEEKYLEEELTNNIGEREVDYKLEKEGKNYIVTYTDSSRSYVVYADGNIGETIEREGLQVGDYVDYIPEVNTTGYTKDNLTEDITGSDKNIDTIVQDKQYAKDKEGMTWQILRIYKDGSIDLIGSTTNQDVFFYGADGYNNGVTIMNDICRTLYSRGKIKARSANYEDIEYWLTDEGKKVRDESGEQMYGHTGTHTSLKLRNYPNLYAQEIGAKIDSGLSGLIDGIDKEKGNTTGLGRSEEGKASGYSQANTSLTVTHTTWSGQLNNINFGEGYDALKTENTYWIASRSVYYDPYEAGFQLQEMTKLNISGCTMFSSDAYSYDGVGHLRPVVTLNASVQIENSVGENGINNMHKITQY